MDFGEYAIIYARFASLILPRNVQHLPMDPH